MEKQKENLFLEKFRLLNSQEHTEEINWSSSCASDYEDTSINDKSSNQVIKTRLTKRKRKNKAPKNITNLSVRILDTSRESKKANRHKKSPILGCGHRHKSTSLSPILKPSQSFQKDNKITSPILISKTMHLKSPILAAKTKSPKSAVKVRKKLFDIGNIKNYVNNSEYKQKHIKQEEFSDVSVHIKEDYAAQSNIKTFQSIKSEGIDEKDFSHGNVSKAKLDLAKRVKTFFDSHFSSDNTSVASQNSISDILTPVNSTKTSDEIEIFTCKTEVLSNNNSTQSIQSLKQQNSTNNSESSLYSFSKNSKKIRYKKDGLAYRLNNLLKKQNASLSLWQHERFLAANSNFVIPKEEFTMFRIQTASFKYGCHLLEAVDVNDDKFIILLNSSVTDSIVSEIVLKLYEPFNIVPYDNDCKLIINVIKIECSNLKS